MPSFALLIHLFFADDGDVRELLVVVKEEVEHLAEAVEVLRPQAVADDLHRAVESLVAHEALSSVDPSLHLLGRTGRLTPEALAERISEYAPLGRAIADGEDAAAVAARATSIN